MNDEARSHPLLVEVAVGDVVAYREDDGYHCSPWHREQAVVVAVVKHGYEVKFESLTGTFHIAEAQVIGVVKQEEAK